MQLTDRSGIQCDKCGMKCQHDFQYFDLIARKVIMSGRKPDMQIIKRIPATRGFDYCSKCYDNLAELIIENYKHYQAVKYRICEVSKEALGNSDYYAINVQKIDVNTSMQPYVCANCKRQSKSMTACQCGSTKYVRPAKVKVTKDMLDFDISKAVFDQWNSHKPPTSEWETKS
jgi:hypothetical protein